MKNTGFKRPAYEPPPAAPLRPLERRANYGGSTGMARPKSPADRHQALRDMANGEECCFRLACCRCDPAYTVLAHTNTQADQKGMQYKGHDSAAVFSCDRCHEAIDHRDLSPAEVVVAWAAAKVRMRQRLRAIAASITERPWRVVAAMRALKLLEVRDGS